MTTSSTTEALAVLKGMYAAEAEYLAAGGAGRASFARARRRGRRRAQQEFLADTSPLVVLTNVRARARNTGRELRFPILQTILVADGRITEVRPFYWDTAAVARACGVSLSAS